MAAHTGALDPAPQMNIESKRRGDWYCYKFKLVVFHILGFFGWFSS
jgi:hypothetical protein